MEETLINNLTEDTLIPTNKYQTPITKTLLSTYPKEVQEQFLDFVNNVPYIKYIIGCTRERACNLPKDKKGRIIVDITHPHILEDMDYFRPAAITFKKTGRYTNLRPNPNPNSEYGKWVREEIRRCYEGYVRPSDGEWVTGNMYFFLNYCPIPMTKVTGNNRKGERVVDFPEFWEGIYYRFHYIEQAQFGGIFDEQGGNNGCEISSRGKAHPYSQIIYTPEGKKKWEDIKIGDLLFTENNNTTKVIDIPFDDIEDVYTITFKDGRKVQASGNHLWKVYRSYSHKMEILSTKEMFQDFAMPRKKSYKNKGVEYNYRVPANKGVEWNEQKIPIDPYTFGLLLGDGSFRTYKLKNSFYFTSAKEDMEIYRKYIPYPIRKMKNYLRYYITFKDAKDTLVKLNLYMKKSKDKFIPSNYLYNSRRVRFNLLKGLMDSDGFIDSNGIPIIGVSSKQLAKDIAFLARSLGYNCLCSIKKGGYKVNGEYKQTLDSYIIRIYTNDLIFNLPRKIKLLSTFSSNYSRSNKDWSTIINIEYSHKERCKCVTVDNPTNLYLIGDFIVTHNSKSLTMAAIMAKYFVLGESKEVCKNVKCMATAYQKQYLTSDGILNKFQSYIDFLAQNTQWPSKRLKSSLQDMSWKMGYYDLDTGTQKGTLNEVMGVSAKDDPSKVRGKRLHFIIVEEFGSFRNVLELYNIMLPSIQEGNVSFGTAYLIGTSGDSESDFQGAAEIVYNPKGYRMYALPNVWDKEGQGKRFLTFFFPGFINRKLCYDHNGNSDVVKALLEILSDRYRIKYNSSDINSITKAIAEIPITPQEAILRTKGNIFPITELNNRLNEIDNNPSFYDQTYVGDLELNSKGEVEFVATNDKPIREFPLKDNNAKGAIEIFEMPIKIKDKVPNERYILSLDNVENDAAQSMSLGSILVLDLWTDRIVAEYTGRPMFADDLNEIARKMCLFYNGRIMVENNKKNTFSYFSRMNSLHLMADCPEYLKQKQIIKYSTFGNSSKGITGTPAIFNFAYTLIRDWLLKPVTVTKEEEGETVEYTVPNLHFINNRALLKECILFNPDINVDRLKSLCQLMLYREEKMILYQNNISNAQKRDDSEDLSNDPFFKDNYDNKDSIWV